YALWHGALQGLWWLGRGRVPVLSVVLGAPAAKARRVLSRAPVGSRQGASRVAVSDGRSAGALQRVERERRRNRGHLARRGRGATARSVPRAAGRAKQPPRTNRLGARRTLASRRDTARGAQGFTPCAWHRPARGTRPPRTRPADASACRRGKLCGRI